MKLAMHLVLRLAFVLALATVAVSPAKAAARSSCWSGYSYVGVQSANAAFGASARLSTMSLPAVGSGHVAAWVGFGGAGMGPGGSDEWIQAGVAADAGGSAHLYFEFKRPTDPSATYVQLRDVAPGETHSVVVYERAAARDSWRVLVDGKSVSDPVMLPGSHDRFQPVATAENWDGGVAGSCNAYDFSFSNLAVRTQYGGAWQPFDLSRVLHDPAYSIALRASGFTATSR